MKKTILLITCFLITIKIFSQNGFTLQGFVKNKFELKLIGASVIISNNNEIRKTISDSNGRYFIVLDNGKYKVEINHTGYDKITKEIEINKNIILDVILEEDINKLEEVRIQSDRIKGLSNTSNNMFEFSPNKLNEIPSIIGSVDIVKLLQLTPGIQNSGDANGYIYVRGAEPGHNLYTYADAPIYGISHLLGIFSTFNDNHVQKMTFDKSNSNPQNGGRLSSSLNIIPVDKVPTSIGVKGNIGLISSQLNIEIPINKKSGLILSGRKTYIDEVLGPMLNTKKEFGKQEQKINYGFSDFNATYIKKISEKQKLTINVLLTGDNLKIIDSNYDLNAKLTWGNTAISSAWQSQLTKKTNIKNIIYYSKYKNNLLVTQGGEIMNISSSISELGYKNILEYEINNIQFESGVQYACYNLQPQKIEVTSLGIENIEKLAKQVQANNFALFINSKTKLTRNLLAEVGLRLNYYTAGSNLNQFLHFEPKILLTYTPNTNSSYFVSYTKQNQYLYLITTSSVGIPTDFWVASSESIPSQTAQEVSIGYNTNIINNIKFSISSYYRTMDKLLEYPYGITQFNEITTLQNDILIGSGQSYGLEVMVKKDYGKVKGWFSYTLGWSERQFNELNNNNKYFAKYDRRHNFALTSSYEYNSKLSIGLTQILSSGNRFTMPTSWYFINNNPVKEYSEFNNAKLPNYVRTDFSLSYYLIRTPKKESILTFSIYNVMNIENPIYVVMDIYINKNSNSLAIQTNNKTLYKIIPSINWRFKF